MSIFLPHFDFRQVLLTSQGEKGSLDDGLVVDYKGNHPVDKTKTGGWLAAGLILGTLTRRHNRKLKILPDVGGLEPLHRPCARDRFSWAHLLFRDRALREDMCDGNIDELGDILGGGPAHFFRKVRDHSDQLHGRSKPFWPARWFPGRR